MDFGITFPSYVEAWRDCEVAEAAGFSHAWFYDTQLLCSDVYATMALAAEHTRTLVLETLVAIPSNRIAPVTASAIATINAIAPERVILGIGTGFTGRNTMGLGPLPVARMVEYVRQVRGLLAGEEAFVPRELIPALTLTGDPGAVRARVCALADAGVDNLAVQVIPGMARELIEEFGREVIGRV